MGGCFIQVQVLKDVVADAIPGGDGRGETPEQALRRELLEAMEPPLPGKLTPLFWIHFFHQGA